MAGDGALIHFTPLELKAVWVLMDHGYHSPFLKADEELMQSADTALEKVYRAERGMA
jgi:hypothetical protein